MTSRVRVVRLALLAALAVGAAAACGRASRAPGGAPTPASDTLAAARRDSAPAGVPAAARADSAARVPAAADTARRGDSTVAGARRRGAAPDPTTRCRVLNFDQSPATSRFTSVRPDSATVIAYVGGGAVARCEGVNNRISSDSAEYFGNLGMLVLIGNVVYAEPARVNMTSARLTYYTSDERIVAEGNVVVRLPSGTTMTGPQAEYFRATENVRPESRLVATGRPTLRIVQEPRRTPGAAVPPPADPSRRDTVIVVANTIVDEGERLVSASGSVQIERTDVVATSDSAQLDEERETARLVRDARIDGRRGRPFTLSGAMIDLYSRQRELTRVVAQQQARIVSEDIDLRSDTVDLRMAASRLERAYAWGPSRAVAVSPDRDVVADSIDARLPGQRIRELRAVRGAVARSAPDTARLVSSERDVLKGDTIVARFDSLAAARDTTRNPPVRQIVAQGQASSFYQVPSQEGRLGRPSLNYVRGRAITVDFDSSQVNRVTVTDSAVGVYLEPQRDSTTADSAGAGGARGRPAVPRAATPRPAAPRPTPSGRPTADRGAVHRAPALTLALPTRREDA